LYSIIKQIHNDIQNELELLNPYDPKIILGTQDNYNYKFRRAIIESIDHGCDVFMSEGLLLKQTITQPRPQPTQQTVIQDNRNFEGWRHEEIEE
jgi:hypothetical protein